MRHLAMTALLVVVAGRVHADPARSVADAHKHFAALDFELVIGDTDAVIHDRTAPVAVVVDAWFLRGSTLVVLDRDAEAAAAFEALLVLAPDHHAPPDTPPRIRAAFEAARAAHAVHVEEQLATDHGAELRGVTLEVVPPANPRGGRAAAWTIRLVDPTHLVDRVVLGYRREPDRDYGIVEAPPAPALQLAVPGGITASDRGYRLGWYVAALHGGARVRHEGDAQTPNWLSVSAGQPPRPPDLVHRWWFWAGVATLAASAVAVPLLIDRARDVGPQQIVFTR